ncbi:hypothetical protein [Pseudarthrobacter sp. fls2-241-R2A-127]|uniref:hypothetical protein n=1 Tax=Pseudarthrobacter sp. fls2-241-R2A-127 TaxID=3040303 RepID=UPI0025529908|nr:hypothetical protein [Pseudarthrobacter sp. fls2-241-R2A-127]
MKAIRILVAACLLFAWQAAPAHGAVASGAAPGDAAVLGNDISWPQCGGGLPGPPAFAVVGVNGGRPDTVNPCLSAQLAWANSTSDAIAGIPAAVYVNTAATGPVESLWWPAGNTYLGKDVGDPYGVCDGTASPACAYVHGYAMAFNDVVILQEAGDAAVRHMWWLDVETENSWLWDTGANAAELEGMASYLESTGAEVGIYSTAYQFGEIVGALNPGSKLSGLKSWLAGAESTSTAQELCGAAPLTAGGTVALVQFTDGDLDYNVRCPAAAPAPAPQAPPEPAPQPEKKHANLYGELRAAEIS